MYMLIIMRGTAESLIESSLTQLVHLYFFLCLLEFLTQLCDVKDQEMTGFVFFITLLTMFFPWLFQYNSGMSLGIQQSKVKICWVAIYNVAVIDTTTCLLF